MPHDLNSITLYDASQKAWLCFRDPESILVANNPSEVLPALREIDRLATQRKHYLAGFVSYEAAPAFDKAYQVRSGSGFPLLWFGIYSSPQVVPAPGPSLNPCPQINTTCETPPQKYLKNISHIKQKIANGETYQVNYTLRLRGHVAADPRDIFARMVRAQGPGYGAYVVTGAWQICSASPELFFTVEGDLLTSRPMKGTADRGLWYQDDLDKAAALRSSAKDQAENLMIVDMVRNDLARLPDVRDITVPRLFDMERFPTLWQMTSTVTCRTRSGMEDIFKALFPPASITGAPKISTMRIIADLEASPRRIYTGTIGFLSPEKRAQFNVAIRTLAVDTAGGRIEYGTGSGIVWDSRAESELSECVTKTKILNTGGQDFSLLESILWTPTEGLFLLEQHLQRLKRSAEYFNFAINNEEINNCLSACISRLPPQDHKLRLLVSPEGTPTVTAQPVSSPRNPPHICLAARAILSDNPWLYHKTTCRDVYQKTLSDHKGFDDVLLWNERQELTESTIANLVVEIKGRRYTPPIACGLLPGVYRNELIRSGQVTERILPKDEIRFFEKIFLVNSVRKMREITLGTPHAGTPLKSPS